MTPLFVKDLARLILTIIQQRFFPNQIYAVAGEDIITWNDMIDVAASQFGKTIKKVALPRLAWAALLRAHGSVFGRSLINPNVLYTLFQDRVYEGGRLKCQLGLTFSSFEDAMRVTCASYIEGIKPNCHVSA